MLNRTCAVIATALTLVACSEEPAVAPPLEEPPRQAAVQELAGFTAEITPPVTGPGGEVQPGRAVWQVMPPQTGGGVTRNPGRSIQLRTTSNFAEGGASGACAGATLSAPVEITNFYPERLLNLYIAFDWTSPTSHAICNASATPPTAGSHTSTTTDDGAFGNLAYTASSTLVAGSALTPDTGACPTCVVPGGAASQPWTFDYATAGSWIVHGRVYAEMYPQPPAVDTPSLNFGLRENLPLQMWVYDTRSAETEPFGWWSKLEICEGTSGGCTGPVMTKTVTADERIAAFRHTNYDITAADLAPEITMTPGLTYLMKAWTLWYPAGSGSTPSGTQYEGSFPLQVAFTLAGTPTPTAGTPADGAGFGDGDYVEWTVDEPDPGRDQVAEWLDAGPFQICGESLPITTANCTTTLYSAASKTYMTATGPDGNGVWTYRWQPNYAAWNTGSTPYPRPAPGTLAYWRIRNQYSDGSHRSGYWSLGHPIIFGDKPTNLASAGTALSFDIAGTNATGAQVQTCGASDCSDGGAPAAASGGPTSWTYTYTGPSGTFYWRARSTYAAGGGPWSAIQTGTAP